MNRDDQSKVSLGHSTALAMSRTAYPSVAPLSNAPRNEAKIYLVHLFKAALRRANLRYANLREAKIHLSIVPSRAAFCHAKCRSAMFSKAKILFVDWLSTVSTAPHSDPLRTTSKLPASLSIASFCNAQHR